MENWHNVDRILGTALKDKSFAEKVAKIDPATFGEERRRLAELIGATIGRGRLLVEAEIEALHRNGTDVPEIVGLRYQRSRAELASAGTSIEEAEILLEQLVDDEADDRMTDVLRDYTKGRESNPKAARRTLLTKAQELIEQRPELRAWGMEELVAAGPDEACPIIEGLLREGEVMNVVAGSKSRKSWLMLDLATCLEHGDVWLGNFSCRKGTKVLVIDNELRVPTIRKRSQAVCERKQRKAGDKVVFLPVRGIQFDLKDIAGQVRRHQPQVVILDALYKFYGEAFDENSNADMTRLFTALDAIATELGIAIVIVHHSSKGGQGQKSTTDVGSGAGAQSRSADTHLVLRPQRNDGDQSKEELVKLDVVARSFPPVPTIYLKWDYPVWVPTDGPASDGGSAGTDEVQEFVSRYYRDDWQPAMTIHERATGTGGMSNRKFDELRDRATTQRLIERERLGRGYTYRKTPDERAF